MDYVTKKQYRDALRYARSNVGCAGMECSDCSFDGWPGGCMVRDFIDVSQFDTKFLAHVSLVRLACEQIVKQRVSELMEK